MSTGEEILANQKPYVTSRDHLSAHHKQVLDLTLFEFSLVLLLVLAAPRAPQRWDLEGGLAATSQTPCPPQLQTSPVCGRSPRAGVARVTVATGDASQ